MYRPRHGVTRALFLATVVLAVGLAAHGPAARAQSGGASITASKSTAQIGETIQLCYRVPGPGPITITDIQPNGSHVLVSGVDDGTGGCVPLTITPPAGQECFRLDYQSSRGSGSTQTCIQVVGASSPQPQPQPQPAASISVSADRGAGAVYYIGDPITICVRVSVRSYVRLTDILADGSSRVIYERYIDGQDCFQATITPPAGREIVRAQISCPPGAVCAAVYIGDEVGFTVADRPPPPPTSQPQPTTISVSIDRGPGATYYVGESMTVCVTVSSRITVRVSDNPENQPSRTIAEREMAGQECLQATVASPAGSHTIRAQVQGRLQVYIGDEVRLVVAERQPQQPNPDGGTLGPVDIDGFCKHLHGPEAYASYNDHFGDLQTWWCNWPAPQGRAFTGMRPDDDANYNPDIYGPSHSLTSACKWQYGRQDIRARQRTPDDPNSWYCTSDSGPGPGNPPNAGEPNCHDHILVVVQGIGSSSNTAQETFADILSGMSQRYDHLVAFSYAAPGQPYTPGDTLQNLSRSADAMHRLIADRISQCDGATIDIIGHSMGGVVALDYLFTTIEPQRTNEGSHIKHLITLDSPVRGSTQDTLVNWGTILGNLSHAFDVLNSEAARELVARHKSEEATGQTTRLNQGLVRALTGRTIIRTFASYDDLLVPWDTATIPGVEEVWSLGNWLWPVFDCLPLPWTDGSSCVGHDQVLRDGAVKQAILDVLDSQP